jgi:hypothetical protein
MKGFHQTKERFGFRAFMLKHQYKVMALSVCFGLGWVGVYRLALRSWFFSRLTLLIAIICFVPAGIVVLIHLREFGPFLWWDKNNRVLTTHRSRKVEKAELILMGILWSIIFVFVVAVIFFLSR